MHITDLLFCPFCRCGIPVIMMGETGCGKTRLLRYLCELQSKIYDNARTMICLKVICSYYSAFKVTGMCLAYPACSYCKVS